LPNLQYLFGLALSSWSVLCVATFTFYRSWVLSLALTDSVVPKLALATSEALPYGCAAFVFGEMWNASDGVGFMMTVAGATYQTDRGMTAFIA
jgi:ABC-type nitrate/sulfonate/bicarbonate transport system permease component